MKIKSIAVTHEGNIRKNNEDNFFVCGNYKNDPLKNRYIFEEEAEYSEYLYSICDGMGGEEFGETASLKATETINDYWKRKDNSIIDCIKTANNVICNEIEKNGGIRMGSTLVALHIKGNKAYVYNIGDSRAYLYRNKKLKQLSTDHSQVASLVRMNIISPEQAALRPERHMLTQYLGIFPDEMLIEPFSSGEIELFEKDIFLLCSDGLTDMLNDKEITGCMAKYDDIDDIIKSLFCMAMNKGGKDNLTIMLVEYK